MSHHEEQPGENCKCDPLSEGSSRRFAQSWGLQSCWKETWPVSNREVVFQPPHTLSLSARRGGELEPATLRDVTSGRNGEGGETEPGHRDTAVPSTEPSAARSC